MTKKIDPVWQAYAKSADELELIACLDPNLKPNDRAIFPYIRNSHLKAPGKQFWESPETIAKKIGILSRWTVGRSLKRLVKYGYLLIKKEGKPGHGNPFHFQLGDGGESAKRALERALRTALVEGETILIDLDAPGKPTPLNAHGRAYRAELMALRKTVGADQFAKMMANEDDSLVQPCTKDEVDCSTGAPMDDSLVQPCTKDGILWCTGAHEDSIRKNTQKGKEDSGRSNLRDWASAPCGTSPTPSAEISLKSDEGEESTSHQDSIRHQNQDGPRSTGHQDQSHHQNQDGPGHREDLRSWAEMAGINESDLRRPVTPRQAGSSQHSHQDVPSGSSRRPEPSLDYIKRWHDRQHPPIRQAEPSRQTHQDVPFGEELDVRPSEEELADMIRHADEMRRAA